MLSAIDSAGYGSFLELSLEKTQETNDGDSCIEAAALPIIKKIGDQAKAIGDSAAPACGACWVACLAGPQAPICTMLCAAMCVSPLTAENSVI